MSEIDLKLFCSDEPRRHEICTPFSDAEWTYATNGHIAVRVPRRSEVDEREDGKTARLREWFQGIESARFWPIPEAELPKPEWEECDYCHGNGNCCDCPNCEGVCDFCDGEGGQRETIYIKVGKFTTSAENYQLIQTLPRAKITEDVNDNGHVWFKGGDCEGLLMPARPLDGSHTLRVSWGSDAPEGALQEV